MRNKFLSLFLLVVLLAPTLFAQGTDELSAASHLDSYAALSPTGPSIVASTSWVGAIAEAAGAQQVLVLAPVELRHPPEYDFSPSDIIKASQADLVLWAGYEGFVRNLVQAAEISDNRLIHVTTNNAPDQLALSVEKVSVLLGTTEAYQVWKTGLDALVEEIGRNSARKDMAGTKVAVQFHHQALARYLGYEVVAVFGPQELTLGDIQKIESLDPDLIMDNWHSIQGEPMRKTGREYVQLVNFPGPFETRSILDVLTYNAGQLGLLDQ